MLEEFGSSNRDASGECCVTASLSLDFPPELVHAIAERVAKILAERDAPTTDGWLRGAEAIGCYIDAPPSRVYALAACRPSRIPVERDGSALIARRSDLDTWV